MTYTNHRSAKKTKRWLLTLLTLLVVGFAVLNMLAHNHAYAMTHFTVKNTRTTKPEELSFWQKLQVLLIGVNVPRPISERVPSDLAPGCRILLIKVPENITLASWYCDQGKETPLVILFHGYTAEKTSMLREATILHDLGASVLLVDFRGSGGSSESYTTIGVRESDDVAAVMRHANDYFSHSCITLFGQSMGAAAILRSVYEHAVVPDAVILEAIFDTMLNTVRNRFAAMGVPSFPSAQLLVFWGGRQWGFDGFAHNPEEYARSLACPALFMHGVDDPRATLGEARRVYAAAHGPKEFKEFEAVGHQSYASKYPDEWRAAVAKIIKKAEARPKDII